MKETQQIVLIFNDQQPVHQLMPRHVVVGTGEQASKAGAGGRQDRIRGQDRDGGDEMGRGLMRMKDGFAQWR